MGFVRKKLSNDDNARFSTSLPVDEAIKIIQDYGEIMLNKSPAPFYIADVKKLPHSKSKIKDALMLALSAKGREAMVDALKIGYLQLANWQEGIGDADLAIGMVDDGKSSEEKLKLVEEHYELVKRWNALLEDERIVLKNDLVSIGVW